MNKNIEKKIREFVEQEKEAPVDDELYNRLLVALGEDTLYWREPPEVRNALNKFFRLLIDEFIRSSINGEYGSMVVLESLVVTAFEVGWKCSRGGVTTPPD